MHVKLKRDIAALMAEAGQAHHDAFAATDGVDPDWAIWYADYLQVPLGKLLETSFTKSELIYCLMCADQEQAARAPKSAWPEFYADHFIEHFAHTSTPKQDKLALYHYVGCPFCSVVTATIDQLHLDVEMRDIFENRKHRDELAAARGRTTVPVLRIISPDGEDRWMPESRDIVHYLETTYR